MANQTWVSMANAPSPSSEGAGSVLKNSTTLTDISPGSNLAAQAFTIGRDCPPLEAGTILRYTARGIFSTTTKPTLVLGLYWGAVAGTVMAESVAITCAESVTNQAWSLEATSRVISVGTTGKILTQGVIFGIEAAGITTTSAGVTLFPAPTSTGGESTIDTSVQKILTIGAKWGTASESNSITCYQWYVETLN